MSAFERTIRFAAMRALSLLLLCLLHTLLAAAAPNQAPSGTNNPTSPHAALSRADARELRTAAVDQELLAAAVLRETNLRRQQRGLSALKHSPQAAEAARIQSEIMRKRGSISHDNPENPRYGTLESRVKEAGLAPRLAAENVATAFGLRYESGKSFYSAKREGKPVFSYKPGGAPIPPHTYASFAKALVDSWMASTGHRENILLKDAEFLGSFCAPSLSKETSMPLYYCTQVFFTPLHR